MLVIIVNRKSNSKLSKQISDEYHKRVTFILPTSDRKVKYSLIYLWYLFKVTGFTKAKIITKLLKLLLTQENINDHKFQRYKPFYFSKPYTDLLMMQMFAHRYLHNQITLIQLFIVCV